MALIGPHLSRRAVVEAKPPARSVERGSCGSCQTSPCNACGRSRPQRWQTTEVTCRDAEFHDSRRVSQACCPPGGLRCRHAARGRFDVRRLPSSGGWDPAGWASWRHRPLPRQDALRYCGPDVSRRRSGTVQPQKNAAASLWHPPHRRPRLRRVRRRSGSTWTSSRHRHHVPSQGSFIRTGCPAPRSEIITAVAESARCLNVGCCATSTRRIMIANPDSPDRRIMLADFIARS